MYPAVNLGMLFTELPWRDRFAAAAAAGFDRVELPWPPLPPGTVIERVRAAGLDVALLNMDGGDVAAGERGYTNDPRRIQRWRGQLRLAVELVGELGCPLVNVLAGRRLTGTGAPTEAEQSRCLTDNLRWAADLVGDTGPTLVVEPINDRDIPGYLLPRVADVLAVIDGVRREAVKLQLDVYHVATMGDDVAGTIAAAGAQIRHVQLADFPGRHEPGTGDLDVEGLLDALTAAGYRGALGLEYVPSQPSAASLRAVTARYPRLGPGRKPLA